MRSDDQLTNSAVMSAAMSIRRGSGLDSGETTCLTWPSVLTAAFKCRLQAEGAKRMPAYSICARSRALMIEFAAIPWL